MYIPYGKITLVQGSPGEEKTTMPVRSLKKNGVWCWEMNSKEVGSNAEQ